MRNISVTLFALLNENCYRSTLFIEFFFMINLQLKSFDQYRLVKSLRKQPPLNALPLRITSKHLLVSAQSHDVNEWIFNVAILQEAVGVYPSLYVFSCQIF